MIENLINLYHSFDSLIEDERQKALAIDAGKMQCLEIPYALQVLNERRAIHTAKLETLRSNQADVLTTIVSMGGSV